MIKKWFVVWACLALLAAGCASRSRTSGSSGGGSQHVDLKPPATFYVEVAPVPDDSPIYAIWDDFFSSVEGKAKSPPFEEVLRKKVTTALRHKGLVPKPPGQAYLLVRASFDAKRPANPEGSEPKQSGAIKYEFKFHLAAFKAGGSQRAAWQGWATHPDTYQNVLNTLYAMIVAVVSHWGEPSQRRDWTGVSRDNPMYLLLNQGP